MAQLTLDDAAKKAGWRDGRYLAYMDKLNELNTDGIEPTMHVLEMSNVFREDVVQLSLDIATALRERAENGRGVFPRAEDIDAGDE